MDTVYTNPNDAVALRLHNWITAPPQQPLPQNVDLFSMLRLHLPSDEHVNYIEPTTGNTYLMSLCTTIHYNPEKRLEMLYWLLDHGADPNITNIYTKKTAIHYLLETLKVLNQDVMTFITDLMTKYYADITSVDSANFIPLGYLASNPHLSITPLYILLTEILFYSNPNPYPLQHNPKTCPISFFAFGNKKRFDIKWPALSGDGKLDSKSIELPFTFQPILTSPDSGHLNQFLPFIQHIADIESQLTPQQLIDLEPALYHYYLYSTLSNNQQSLVKPAESELCLSHPQLYTMTQFNPFSAVSVYELKAPTNRYGEEQAHDIAFAIEPTPITSLFTILPRLDTTITHHNAFNSLRSQQSAAGQKGQNGQNDGSEIGNDSTPPIPVDSIITNPTLPPIAMLRFLWACDEAFFVDPHLLIVLMLNTNSYLTPRHVDIIKFLLLLQSDRHYIVGTAAITQIFITLFTKTYTIPSFAQLKQIGHVFADNATIIESAPQHITTTLTNQPRPRPVDFYGHIPQYEDQWIEKGLVDVRTKPYFDLCDLLMALFEQCYYREYCPKRNPANSRHSRYDNDDMESVVGDLLSIVLFISGSHHSKLHNFQIIPIHKHLLSYTSFNNRYTNTRALLDQFEKHGVDEQKEIGLGTR